MIVRAREREIDLEIDRKRRPNSATSVEGLGKRPKVSDCRPRDQHERNRYGKCGKSHEGMCRGVGLGCFKCVQTGHISRHYTATTPITLVSDLIGFQCNQRGHNKAYCQSLVVVGPVSAPAPAKLRITDGHKGQAVAPATKNRVFQLTTKEARAAPSMVTSMYLLLIFLFILN